MLAEIRDQFATTHVAILEAHIARRCTDQAAHCVLFLILAHVVLQQFHV